jgi:hypothetical protein
LWFSSEIKENGTCPNPKRPCWGPQNFEDLNKSLLYTSVCTKTTAPSGGALCSIMIRQTYDVEGKQGWGQKEAIGHMAQKAMASHGGAQA